MKKLTLIFSIYMIASMLLAACAPAATPTVAPTAAPVPVIPTGTIQPTYTPYPTYTPVPKSTAAPTTTAVPQPKNFISWLQFDQDNTDPASDERVGAAYLRETIPQFNKEFKDKWIWINIPKAFDKIGAQLSAATIAGGDVPDMVIAGRSLSGAKNGVFMDLNEWAKAQSWYEDLDPGSIATCTIDGKLTCIPIAQTPNLTYVWKDRYPNGYPTTADQFLVEAERLKKEGKYAITFFGSTAFKGNAFGRGMWDIVSSFGGKYDDNKGSMLLNTPENIAAIKFIREIVAKGYVAPVSFAGNFQEEEAFKDSSAGAFPTGLFGYRYVNPLTAPSGKKYATKTSQDMLDAIAAGDVILRPSFAAEGKKPGCNLGVAGLGIPRLAKNADAAKDYINWIMSKPENNAKWVVTLGGGFPVLKSVQSQPDFQAPFYKQAAEAINKSSCSEVAGSLKRPEEAAVIVTNVIYKLIKENPTLDIAAELTKAQAEYNKGN